jgi:hypothetical protein
LSAFHKNSKLHFSFVLEHACVSSSAGLRPGMGQAHLVARLAPARQAPGQPHQHGALAAPHGEKKKAAFTLFLVPWL